MSENGNIIADRIEAATTEKSSAVNNAAVREALTNLTRYKESDIRQLEQLAKLAIDNDIYGGGILQSICEAIREVKEALSKPPRNCDVGTAEEQERRFRKYCETEECNRYRCGHGCKAMCIDRCAVTWAQMPYEANESEAAK